MSPVQEEQPGHDEHNDQEEAEDKDSDEAGSKQAADKIARIAIEQAQGGYGSLTPTAFHLVPEGI